MKERKACILIFLFFLLCSCLLAKLYPEQYYMIPESEVQGLQLVSTGLQQNKQILLSRVTTLRTTVNRLESDSMKLNELLETERTSVQSLMRSFDQYEADQYRIISEYETQITILKDEISKGKVDLVNTQKTRNTFVMLFLLVLIVNGAFLLIKFRKVLGI